MMTCLHVAPAWMPMSFGCVKRPGHDGDHVWVHRSNISFLLTAHLNDFRAWQLDGSSTRHDAADCHSGCFSWGGK